jgi:hypothetical protein
MHPLIAKFLDLSTAVATLEKPESALDADETAWRNEVKNDPKARDAIVRSGGKSANPKLQQQAIVVAVRAATARLLEDPALGPQAKEAMRALELEGASPDEARGLVAEVLLEEAFGYAEDPAHFDAAYVSETLQTLKVIAKVNADVVDDWLERWSKAGKGGDTPMRVSVAETLLDAAWSEGPQPIGPEHLDDTLEAMADAVAQSEFPQALEVLAGFLTFLASEKIIGPARLARLTAILSSAAHSGETADDGEEDDDEEDDEAP